MNPAGALLVAGGAAAVIVGIRGSQSTTWEALFGRASKGDGSTSSTADSTSTGAPTATLLPAPVSPYTLAPAPSQAPVRV